MNHKTQYITKHVQLQISGDRDAVNAAIAILHALNFINGSIWSNPIRKRGSQSIVRVAARAIDLPLVAVPVQEDDAGE